LDKGKDMNKQFAVLGLGSFGRSVALSLEKMGCDVMVVDDSYEKIQEISDKVSYAMKADVTDKDALQALGARNLDGAVVAGSEHPEANIFVRTSWQHFFAKRWGFHWLLQRRKINFRERSWKK